MAAAIEVEQLHVVRGGQVVIDDLSVTVAAGRVTGLLGPSGCGKSTLMRAIVGVQLVAGGAIRVLGLPAGASELRSRVSYMTQRPSVYGDLTVRENLEYVAAILREGSERVAEVLATVGLRGSEHRLAGSLSGGQLARVSLATALLGRPELLVLDEPTVGLDPVLRAELWETFHALAGDGASLLVSSHVMDEAAECDDLLLMREGALLRVTTPQGLREETGEHELGRAFLAVIGRQAAA